MNKLKALIPLFAIAAVTCLIFFKIFLKGLYPVPGDLLVSFYFPWYAGGWEGYNPWTTRKELTAADAIRMGYLWKEFAANEFKDGRVPLWNPHTFSGQPLVANLQSGIYYPLDLVYFFMDPKNAWIFLIVIEPFLAGVFMYILLKSFNLSQIASTFGSIAFMFSSYLISWMEIAIVGNSYLWFPLSFWAINMYFKKGKIRFILVLCGSLTLSILSGHPPTMIYHFIATSLFFLYKVFEFKTHKLSTLGVYIATAVGALFLSAVQLIPTVAFYKQAPLALPFSREVFDRSILPLKNLVTFFASDFFGNPASNNFWSQAYGDFTPYIGVIPLIFALWAIFKLNRNKFVKFAALMFFVFILAAIRGPITYIIRTLQIPLLDSTSPSRFIAISIFFLTILAGFGLDDFLKNIKDRKYKIIFLRYLIVIGIIYSLLWSFAVFGSSFLKPKEMWDANLAVTRRNLILPSAMFLSVFLLAIALLYINLTKKFAILISSIGLFFATLIGGVYYTNKSLPVAPKQFIFPNHQLFDWLKNNAGIDRFYGGGTAHIDFNFPTHYRIYAVEGYDAIRFSRYAELLAASFNGEVPETYLRSDAVVPNEENGHRRRLFALLGVRYLLNKEDNPKSSADWQAGKFPGDDVEGWWQYEKFQIYKRRDVLPRFFQTTKYSVEADSKEIIKKIYDKTYDLQTLTLEQEPPIKIDSTQKGIVIPKLEKYTSNQVTFLSKLNYNSLLFLSDAYSDDWKVYIDGKNTSLLRTHYALRSVAVPSGDHSVSFKYEPKSFMQGFSVTSLSGFGLFLTSIYFFKKRKF